MARTRRGSGRCQRRSSAPSNPRAARLPSAPKRDGAHIVRNEPLERGAIGFNGNAFLGQAGDPFVMERTARDGIIARVGSGGARRAVRRCDTRGQPYDLAVCSSLIVLLRHLGVESRVGTSGTLRTGWSQAARLVRDALGDNGQLVQTEHGMLRWLDASARRERGLERSSA